jgi:hypothetical protein
MEKNVNFNIIYMFLLKNTLALDSKNRLQVQMEYHEPHPPLEAWVTIYWVSILKYSWNILNNFFFLNLEKS